MSRSVTNKTNLQISLPLLSNPVGGLNSEISLYEVFCQEYVVRKHGKDIEKYFLLIMLMGSKQCQVLQFKYLEIYSESSVKKCARVNY